MIDPANLKEIVEQATGFTVYLEQGITKDILLPFATYRQINFFDGGISTFKKKTEWMNRNYQIDLYDTSYSNLVDKTEDVIQAVKDNYGDITDYAEFYDNDNNVIRIVITVSFKYKI